MFSQPLVKRVLGYIVVIVTNVIIELLHALKIMMPSTVFLIYLYQKTKIIILVLHTLEQVVDSLVFVVQIQLGFRIEFMEPEAHRSTAPAIIDTIFRL